MIQQSGAAMSWEAPRLLLFAYFVIGILTSLMMPYELLLFFRRH
jgi:hypothetical protein